jgi:hypothetical protein
MYGRMHACQLPGAAGIRPRLTPRKMRGRVNLVILGSGTALERVRQPQYCVIVPLEATP